MIFKPLLRPVVPGCAGCAMAHPDFGRSVNPISTRGDRLCPPRSFDWTETKLVPSPIRCALSWADTKMSYQYFLFVFSCYVKPKSISEKFESNFVKQFLP